jgi:hypothetical protein
MLNLTFRRRAGDFLNYLAEASPEFDLPFARSTRVSAQPPRNLFDGTGTVEAGISLPLTEAQGFLRLSVLQR